MTGQRHGHHGALAAALAAATIVLSGCAAAGPEMEPQGIEAAVKEAIPGSELNRLTLTEQAVERLDLTTEPVAAGTGSGLEIPYSALIYDPAGDTWVYTNPEPLVFVRAPVEVDRIEGDVVHISDGPEPGTEIVTLGAAELFGAEFDTAH